MEKFYIVTSENPSASELDVGIFKSKMKAKKAFSEKWQETIGFRVDDTGIEIIQDEDIDREYYFFDGYCGFTVKLQEKDYNEMFPAI